MQTFFDGHYFVEDVAAARIKNYLSYGVADLNDEQTKEVARIIMGALVGHLRGIEEYEKFIEVRKEKWNVPQMRAVHRRVNSLTWRD